LYLALALALALKFFEFHLILKETLQVKFDFARHFYFHLISKEIH